MTAHALREGEEQPPSFMFYESQDSKKNWNFENPLVSAF